MIDSDNMCRIYTFDIIFYVIYMCICLGVGARVLSYRVILVERGRAAFGRPKKIFEGVSEGRGSVGVAGGRRSGIICRTVFWWFFWMHV